ncbi:MAG: Asp-tRNA(Asn)/Glu-tRNA(Gln) amidotransferase subunit GatB, partial [Emcibacteraceae bacterium]|nr:Asp-tRNA(Asn)/Glu-tRNA(Gln) amidotransferase subunit GatB [Emcibacteraceae bacterium]
MSNLYQGATGEWEVVIGLEIHAQVTSEAKLFSGASTKFGSAPNTQVSFVCSAQPGMLPVINEECVRQAVRTGLAMGCKINLRSVFDRKNYFYADLPQGYQISQFKDPIVGEGILTVDLEDGSTKDIGIERLHLEQDAGKSMHDQHPTMTYVDLNRSGVALMEIVSMPDMRSAEEAGAYFRKIRSIVRYAGTCDGNMDQGSMRADVNVSVRRVGAELGTRTETKNVNSVRYMMQVIESETRRQVDVLEDGGTIKQETRLFEVATGTTRTMRSKEEAHDYRYFPDPDLLPLEFSQEFVDELAKELPELADAKKQRFIRDLNINAYNADVLVAEKESADYFEELLAATVAKSGKSVSELGTLVSNWVTSDLFGALKKLSKGITESPVSTADAAELLT